MPLITITTYNLPKKPNHTDMYTAASTTSDSKSGQLKAILYLLQMKIEEIKDEVDKSYALLQVGELTDLTRRIQKSLSDPMHMFVDASNKIDAQLSGIVDSFVKAFIKINNDIILRAFRNRTERLELFYSIVLSEDRIENRMRIFRFFDEYDKLDIATKYPVHFQFVPNALVDKLKTSEEIPTA